MAANPTSRETGIILQESDDAKINQAFARGLHFGLRLKQTSTIRILMHSVRPESVPKKTIQRVVDREESGRHAGIAFYQWDDAQLNQMLQHALAHNFRLTQQLALRVLIEASQPQKLSEKEIRRILASYPTPSTGSGAKSRRRKRGGS